MPGQLWEPSSSATWQASFSFELVTAGGTHAFRAQDRASFFLWIDTLQQLQAPRRAPSLVSAKV